MEYRKWKSFFWDSIGNVLSRAGISPQEIDLLVVNVSMLAAVPSLTSRIINHYKMRSDIKSFNLASMGCSASLISLDIIRNVFKSYKNKFALLLTSESLSLNWYAGSDRSMILSNCLFRSGGCAILLTNNKSLKHKAMFKLKCLVRTNHGAIDESYDCCIQKEDAKGRMGFHLGKTLPKAATHSLTDNLRTITPKILPVRELVWFMAVSLVKKWNLRHGSTPKGAPQGPIKAGVNFKSGVDHFCIHTGGKAVIDGIAASLDFVEQGRLSHTTAASQLVSARLVVVVVRRQAVNIRVDTQLSYLSSMWSNETMERLIVHIPIAYPYDE
ncbi:3-ketoacyl-CoA synthase 12 [Hibiscus syriacus]|uniref:3-ketoacyl-CoA synthase 12 n=1 Tax=Hibiscus syriacus TaxID=106335 RepID=A0A6A2XQU7_HIBSY|nr:3-ketoacyl-CoA synthase 12 [Hibiscus syriacus]